jgi:hypothetical protein
VRRVFTSGRTLSRCPRSLPGSEPPAPWTLTTCLPAAGRGTWAACGEDPQSWRAREAGGSWAAAGRENRVVGPPRIPRSLGKRALRGRVQMLTDPGGHPGRGTDWQRPKKRAERKEGRTRQTRGSRLGFFSQICRWESPPPYYSQGRGHSWCSAEIAISVGRWEGRGAHQPLGHPPPLALHSPLLGLFSSWPFPISWS